MKTMDVQTIVKNFCVEHGYDGLCNLETDCGCDIDDMFPCGEIYKECETAHRVEQKEIIFAPGKKSECPECIKGLDHSVTK